MAEKVVRASLSQLAAVSLCGVSSHSPKTCRSHGLQTLNCLQMWMWLFVCVLALWLTGDLSGVYPCCFPVHAGKTIEDKDFRKQMDGTHWHNDLVLLSVQVTKYICIRQVHPTPHWCTALVNFMTLSTILVRRTVRSVSDYYTLKHKFHLKIKKVVIIFSPSCWWKVRWSLQLCSIFQQLNFTGELILYSKSKMHTKGKIVVTECKNWIYGVHEFPERVCVNQT